MMLEAQKDSWERGETNNKHLTTAKQEGGTLVFNRTLG